jgi:MoaA/NifB/PqqE/SkfB family radical SAM enzyme
MSIGGLSAKIEELSLAGVKRYEITGDGEPTLHPALNEIISTIRANSNTYIKLYSNGRRLPHGAAVDELNISRAAFDAKQNQAIMRYRGASPSVEEIVESARAIGYTRIRLSVPIIKGGIDTLERALHFLNAVCDQVDGVVFRPLYPATPERIIRDPSVDTSKWEHFLTAEMLSRKPSCTVEVDSEGCFRASQLILASDLEIYSNWSLSTRVQC